MFSIHYVLDMDCGIEIKFRIFPKEKDGQLTEEYMEEIKRFLLFKEMLHSKIAASNSTDKQYLIRQLYKVENFQRRIEQIYQGSIFIAISCPSEESMVDLRNQLESGELRRIVMEAFEIEQLKQECKLSSLEVLIKLNEIRKQNAKRTFNFPIRKI